MAKTESTMIPLGTKAIDFKLPDSRSQKPVSLTDCQSSIATVIMFISNHCPYVQHIQNKLVEIANQYQAKGIKFIAICSNDITKYPDDSPERMREVAEQLQYPFPYLYDETQEVARSYHAACTPDFYIFDKNMACVYRGCFDESTPGNNLPVTGEHLTRALDCILAGKPVSTEQKPSLGCNIKWKG